MKASLPLENIYGHTEKLQFFISALAQLRVELGRELRILDIGCGNGWAVTQHLGQLGNEVLGIDMHAPSIAYAQCNFAREGVSFRCESAETLQNELTEWDAIVLADVLEHLDNPQAVLLNCHELLATHGRILVAVPNGWGPFEMESALARTPVIGKTLMTTTDFFIAILNKYVIRGLWTRAVEELPKDIPYNHDSSHIQFKSHSAWLNLFNQCGYQLKGERKLAFLSGPFSNYLLGASRILCSFNVRLASKLPSAIVSNWAFVLQRSNDATQ